MVKDEEKQISILMKNLNISRAEPLAVIEDDKAIDRGAKLFEQTAEQKKATKKYSNVEIKTTKKADSEKVKKVDKNKNSVINLFIDCVNSNGGENVTVEKEGAEITFILGGQKYRLKLTKARK